MKSIKFLIMAIFLLLIFNMSLLAQGVELSDAVTIQAEVYGIEKIDRTLWLIGPNGNIAEIEVSEDAKNFDQLKIGDLVNITYYESVALYLGELPENNLMSKPNQ